MTALPKYNKMTVDEFFAWAQSQEGRRELFDGVPVAMSPERAVHGRVKLRAANSGSSLKLDPPGLEMAVVELFPPD
jgi:Uma2 family endonuclease